MISNETDLKRKYELPPKDTLPYRLGLGKKHAKEVISIFRDCFKINYADFSLIIKPAFSTLDNAKQIMLSDMLYTSSFAESCLSPSYDWLLKGQSQQNAIASDFKLQLKDLDSLFLESGGWCSKALIEFMFDYMNLLLTEEATDPNEAPPIVFGKTNNKRIVPTRSAYPSYQAAVEGKASFFENMES